jgi:aspartate 1-decarboxylase
MGVLKMLISVCKSKIHNARLTGCDLDYEGSLLVDIELLREAGIYPYEKILVVNKNNGERLETYAIPGKPGTKDIMLNGAAAKKGTPGDTITIMTFGLIEENQAESFLPKIIVLNEKNNIIAKKGALAQKLR